MDRNSKYIQEVHVSISSCDVSQISHYDFNDTNNINVALKLSLSTLTRSTRTI